MSQENKVISIAVGDKIKIEGVGTVELVVVAPEQNEQPKQHPLVGKWVRCIESWSLGKVALNKWYPVTGLDKDGDLIIPSGDKTDDVGYCEGVAEKHFDLSNPCDFDCNIPEAINPKYKVGDEVVVVNNIYTRGLYKESFYYLGLKDKIENNGFRPQTKAVVFNICFCQVNNFNLYALRDSEGNECVIGEEGIKLAGINKQEWLDAASRLFDSWMKISGGYVPTEMRTAYHVKYIRESKKLIIDYWNHSTVNPLNFENTKQAEQFLQENEKDLKTFFHQV
jgi:hypothetical protein